MSTVCVVDTREVTRAREQLGGSSHAVNNSILHSTKLCRLLDASVLEDYFAHKIVIEMLNKMTNPYDAKCRGRDGVERARKYMLALFVENIGNYNAR